MGEPSIYLVDCKYIWQCYMDKLRSTYIYLQRVYPLIGHFCVVMRHIASSWYSCEIPWITGMQQERLVWVKIVSNGSSMHNSNIKDGCHRIPIIKIRRSRERIIFIMRDQKEEIQCICTEMTPHPPEVHVDVIRNRNRHRDVTKLWTWYVTLKILWVSEMSVEQK